MKRIYGLQRTRITACQLIRSIELGGWPNPCIIGSKAARHGYKCLISIEYRRPKPIKSNEQCYTVALHTRAGKKRLEPLGPLGSISSLLSARLCVIWPGPHMAHGVVHLPRKKHEGNQWRSNSKAQGSDSVGYTPCALLRVLVAT